MTRLEALVFVYNADSGLVNGALDLAHKLLSPETYACKLCALTYGIFGMRRDWRRFAQGLPVPAEFLHADELRARCAPTSPLPAVFARSGEGLEPFIGAEALNACATLQDLQALVLERLAEPAAI